MIIVNLAQIFIIISLGFIITIISAKIFSLTLQRAIILFIWHTFFSFAYAWYVSKFGGDANSYYNSAQDENYLFGFSTAFIVFISSFLLDFVNLSFISMNIKQPLCKQSSIPGDFLPGLLNTTPRKNFDLPLLDEFGEVANFAVTFGALLI